ncbi:MAG: ParB N-terminal domain-containing protein [Thermoguttaceae bacterium]|nr:ParB N-terminal domain-containing protein [Thermoguttaceae bacterium]
MKITDVSIDKIVPYENNPRNNDAAVAGVAESIRRFGFQQPIVVDANGTIVCGHTRYLAAKKLGLASAPCVVADELSETDLKAYRLLDNKLSELSTWRDDLLASELASLEFDFEPFGVEFLPPEPPNPDEASAPELPESHKIIVDCETEEQMDALYERLVGEGYAARICRL